MMWLLLALTLFAFAAVGTVSLIRHVHRFSALQRLAKKHPAASWVLAIGAVLLLGPFACVNVWTMVIIVLHLILAFWLSDAAAWILGRITRRTAPFDVRGALAIALTAVYLGIGCFLAFHVFEVPYTLSSGKLTQPVRIVAFADSHLGITLNGERFAAEMSRIDRLSPDAVVVVGDFVDDDSDKSDMLRACEALGALHTTYGVYFVYGNHDNGYYQYRNFTSAQLRTALEANGVTVLTDSSALLGDSIELIGRRDRSMTDQLDMTALTTGSDASRYRIVLDHQPNDYTAEAAATVDLVVSGHTHGGHIFPAGQIGVLIGANDRRYGIETRGETTFLVTSGISGWAIPIKTGTHSEYIVLDLVPAA